MAIKLTGLGMAACLAYTSTVMAKPPTWVHQNGIKQNGYLLTVVSTGTGPSLDLARRSAIDQAKATAADQANGSAYIRSLSIETEKSASFHSEVSSTKKVENLSCHPLSDYSENEDGVYTVWIKCEFDLKKAHVFAVDESEDRATDRKDSSRVEKKDIEIVGHTSAAQAPPIGQVSYGEDRHLILAVVPLCESILIRGQQSRTISCKENPITLLILQTDTELIVRGPAGFAPKHLRIHEKPIDVAPTETLEVYLDKM